MARARLRYGLAAKALELALELAAERPGSGHARFLVAEAQVALVRFPEAAQDFSAFLDCWAHADTHLPELQRARMFMSGRGRHLRVVEASAVAAHEPRSVGARKKASC